MKSRDGKTDNRNNGNAHQIICQGHAIGKYPNSMELAWCVTGTHCTKRNKLIIQQILYKKEQKIEFP